MLINAFPLQIVADGSVLSVRAASHDEARAALAIGSAGDAANQRRGRRGGRPVFRLPPAGGRDGASSGRAAGFPPRCVATGNAGRRLTPQPAGGLWPRLQGELK